MDMAQEHSLEPWGFAEFDRMAELYRRTRLALDTFLRQSALDEAATCLLATETLAHVEDMEAGFRGWLRASQAGGQEMRDLVSREVTELPGPRSAAERRAATAEAVVARRLGAAPRIVPAATRWLVALRNARLVFALLPRLPDEDVRFPTGRRTYVDIPVPASPGELAARIEELERELWRAASGRDPRPWGEAFRRTYGFFDVAEHLSARAAH